MRSIKVLLSTMACLAVLAGCSREGSPQASGQDSAPKPQAEAPKGHPLEGVWDFVTSVDWKGASTSYLRGTLYVQTENNQLRCALTAFQEHETKNFLVDTIENKTGSAEQDCQIFANEGEFSIKSSVRRGGEGYAPDDFSLRQVGKNMLEGKLVSTTNFDATFVKRGSSLQLAKPWRMADRDQADQIIAPFNALVHGKTGCVFGLSTVRPTGDAERGILFDLRRLCRSNEAGARLTDDKDYFELRQGYYLACAKKQAYENWKTFVKENGTPIRTVYANRDGAYTEAAGQWVPNAGEGAPALRIHGGEMAAKGFRGEQVNPNTVLDLVARQHCG